MTYVVVRYHHWLILALLMKKYYESQGKVSKIVVLNNASLRVFLEVGLSRNEEVLSVKEFDDELKKGGEFEIACHHSEAFLVHLFSNLSDEAKNNINLVSFYADGFTNRFLNINYIEQFLENSNLEVLRIIFFDKMEKIFPYMEKSRVDVIDAILLKSVFRNDYFYKLFLKSQYLDVSQQKKSKILLLRPWGSSSFQGGKFITNKNILLDFVANCTNSFDGRVLVRPDYRDKEYAKYIVQQLNQNFPDISIVDESTWPSWLTFDPFIYHYSLSVVEKPILTVSDSTAASPFLKLGLIGQVELGIPDLIYRKYYSEDNAIGGKIRMLKRIYSEYDQLIKIKNEGEYFQVYDIRKVL